ncbi:MAG: gamma-glutamylcyclotransferase family protein [Tissierellia bacterium]|nr:gamma-glutamylcyclotransferase family protein [Tissierellia bacterium]
MKYYIAYGSNLNRSLMKKFCPGSELVAKAKIKNAVLRFRGHGYLNLEIGDFDTFVYTAIWKIDRACEKALDIYEDYPKLYDKVEIDIKIKDDLVKAFYYKMNKPYDSERAMPKKKYVKTVLKGYKDMNFETSALDDAIEEIGFEK